MRNPRGDSREHNGDSLVLAFAGIVALRAAATRFTMPGITALVLLYIIGAWAVFRGVFEIECAIQLRKEIATNGC